MPNYNEAQGVADLLSKFDFNIISEGPVSDIAETLDNELGEVKEEVERVQAERKAKHEFEHPAVPEGFTSIEDLQASLDLGEYGDRITDYTGNIGDAFSEIADSATDIYTYDLLKWLPDICPQRMPLPRCRSTTSRSMMRLPKTAIS